MSQHKEDTTEHFPIPCSQGSTADQQNSFEDEFEELQQQLRPGAAETAQLQQASIRDAEIAQLKHQVRESNAEIAHLQHLVRERDVEIAQLQHQLISQHDKIAQVKCQLRAGHDRMAQAVGHISASQRSLQVSERILGDFHTCLQGRQERVGGCRSHFGGQEACGARLPLTNCPPNVSVSNTRLIMTDSSDLRQQAVALISVDEGRNDHRSTHLPFPLPQSSLSTAAAEAQEDVVNNHADGLPSSSFVTFDTMPEQQKIDLLFQILSRVQQEKNDIGQRMDNRVKETYQRIDEIHTLQGKVASLHNENVSLRTQLNILLSNKQTPAVLRTGAKRGRFILSKAQVVECSYCLCVFSSFEDAHSSLCGRHTKPATELPNKMVDKMHETNSKLRYWPCCKQISTHIPPPCFNGEHELRYL